MPLLAHTRPALSFFLKGNLFDNGGNEDVTGGGGTDYIFI